LVQISVSRLRPGDMIPQALHTITSRRGPNPPPYRVAEIYMFGGRKSHDVTLAALTLTELWLLLSVIAVLADVGDQIVPASLSWNNWFVALA
jgi:hypothetical protein